MLILQGDTRIVLITKQYAIKIPKFQNKNFYGIIYTMLTGWIANRNEFLWHKSNIHNFFCPVKLSILFSFIIIMEKAIPINKKEFKNIKKFNFGGYEHKISSYGKINGKIVIVDYGDYSRVNKEEKIKKNKKSNKADIKKER